MNVLCQNSPKGAHIETPALYVITIGGQLSTRRTKLYPDLYDFHKIKWVFWGHRCTFATNSL